MNDACLVTVLFGLDIWAYNLGTTLGLNLNVIGYII